MSSPWVCYLIASTDPAGRTYVGASPDAVKRLMTHNSGRGAKATRGNTWEHVLIVSGFPSKRACLSFESGWKRRCRYRRVTDVTDLGRTWTGLSVVEKRILDLQSFLHHARYQDDKYVWKGDGDLPNLHVTGHRAETTGWDFIN